MKIAILHHDLEPTEQASKEFFELNGIPVDLIDIRKTSLEELKKYNLIFNRVYSSVCFRDYSSLPKTINLLKDLEESGVNCINNYNATSSDCNKYEMYLKLSKEGILTPPTLFINSLEEIDVVSLEAAEKFGFPLVVKRNCGGGSRDMSRVNSITDLKKTIENKLKNSKNEGYYGGFVIQKFMKSIRDFDCRVGIVNGKFSISYKRNFIKLDSNDKWVASVKGGSTMEEHKASEEEILMAIKASSVLGGFFSESDIILTKEGPCVIEVNLTPKYDINDQLDSNIFKNILNSIYNALIITAPNEKSIPQFE